MSELTNIRALSYNLHKGFSAGNFRYVLEDIKQAIRVLNLDLVFLQEVMGNQYEFLADEVWPHFAYGKNAVYSKGDHGNAILSRFPFKQSKNLDISLNSFEKRGLLLGEIEVPFSCEKFVVACTHLNLFAGSRLKQISQICQTLSQVESDALILAGDFNDWRQEASLHLETHLGVEEVFDKLGKKHPRTFPSLFPLLRVDRIYQRGFSTKNAEVFDKPSWSRLSDHLPIFVELEIPAAVSRSS